MSPNGDLRDESSQVQRSYRELLESLDAIVVEVDASNDHLLYVSPQAEKILGFPLDLWYGGRSFWRDEIVHDDDRGTVSAAISEAIEKESSTEAEFRALRADGVFIWLRATFSFDAGERIVCGLIRDISRERSSEEVLRKSKDQLQLALEAAGMGVWDWNLEESTVFWSNEVYHLHGLEAGEIELDHDGYLRVLDRIHPDDVDAAQEIVRRALSAGEDYDLEYRIMDGDRIRWLLARGRIYTGEHGGPVRVSGTVQDITSRKEAEEALREETKTLHTLSQVNAVLAGELDLEKLIQAVTDAGTKLTGAEFGAFFYNVVNEEGEAYMLYTLSGAPREAFESFPMPRNTEIFNPTFSGQGTVRLDDVTQDPRYGKNPPYHGMPEGHLPVRSYLATPVVGRGGDVIGGLFFGHAEPGVFTYRAERVLGAIADQAAIAIENARLYNAIQIELGERKRAEAELVELAATLEQRVKERTAEVELVNVALRQSNRELQDFAYVASHDLQEPLRKITTFADLLRMESSLGSESTDYLDRMRSAAERMTELIRGLLEFSRVKTQGSAFEQVDLNQVLQNVLTDLEIRIEESNGRVDVGDLPEIEADPLQMRQLFQNLVSNALKFRRRDTPPIVAVEGSIEDGTSVRISVRDNGIGFETEYARRIFSPFQRLHGREEYEGTGMGLAICRRIAERHHGSISATSIPGSGSNFTILLPLRQPEWSRLDADETLPGEGD